MTENNEDKGPDVESYIANESVREKLNAAHEAFKQQLGREILGGVHLFVVEDKEEGMKLMIADELPRPLKAPEILSAIFQMFGLYIEAIIELASNEEHKDE